MGRQSTFTQEVADEICERLSDGESLRAICSEDGMPRKATVFRWLGENERFRDQYARAREVQADALFDDVLSIADDSRNDWMRSHGEDDAGWVANGDNIRRSQIRIDARKWMAGKLRPKKYGDFKAVELTGADGGPLQVSAALLSDEDLAKIASRAKS